MMVDVCRERRVGPITGKLFLMHENEKRNKTFVRTKKNPYLQV